MTELSSLVIKFGADITDIKTGINSIHGELGRLESAVGKTSGMLGHFAGSLGRIAEQAAGFVVANVALRGLETTFGAVSNAVVGFNAKLTNAQIGFETMLGSADKAKSLLSDLQQFAATTPFQFPELVQASQRLISFGFAARDVIPTLTAVGDAAAASGTVSQESIGRITTALGQMAARGKASSQEMLQLTEAGIPSWAILASAIGKTTAETMKMVEDGLIPADVALKALIEGMENRAPGAMEKMQHTWTGAISNIKDSFEQLSARGLKPVFDGLTVLADKLAVFLGSTAVDQFATRVSTAMGNVAEALDLAFHGRAAEAVAEFALAGQQFTVIGQQIQFGFLRIVEAIEPAVQPIVATLTELAINAAVWGFNLMAEFGAGMISGAATVIVSAMSAIGGMIADFIASFSPPKKGALRNINIWGANLINEYFKGFMNADFSVFDSLTKTIQDLLKIQVVSGNLGELEQIPRLIELQELMGRAITQTREYGQVSDDVWQRAGELLGDATDDVRGLFDALVQLADVNSKIDDINGQLRKYQQELNDVDSAWRELERPIEASIRAAERAYRENVRGIDEEIRAIDRKIAILRDVPRPDTSDLDLEIARTRELSDQERLQDAQNAHLERARRLNEDIAGINERINRGIQDRQRDLDKINADTERTIGKAAGDNTQRSQRDRDETARRIARENEDAARRQAEIQRNLARDLANEKDPTRAAGIRTRASEQSTEVERARAEKVADLQRESGQRLADWQRDTDERVADARRQQVEKTADIERRSAETQADLQRQLGEKQAQLAKDGEQTNKDRLDILQAQKQLVEDTVNIEVANREPQVAALQAQKSKLQANKDLYADQKDEIERQKALLAEIKQGHADEAQAIRDKMEPLQQQRDALQLQRDDLQTIASTVQNRIGHERDVAELLERQAKALEQAAAAGAKGGGAGGKGLGGAGSIAGVGAGVKVPKRLDRSQSFEDVEAMAAAQSAEDAARERKINEMMARIKKKIKDDIKSGFKEGFDEAIGDLPPAEKLVLAWTGVGALIGFAVGGPIGAAIGATVGGAIAKLGIEAGKYVEQNGWAGTGKNIGGFIFDGVKSGFDLASRGAQWGLDSLGDFKDRWVEDAEHAGRDIINGIKKGAKFVWDETKEFFTTFPQSMLNLVKTTLGINSPSTEFESIGKDIINGLIKGAKDKWEDIKRWFEETKDRATGAVGNLTETLKDHGTNLVGGLWNGGKDKWTSDVKPWLTDTGSRAKGEIGDLSESTVDRGRELLTGWKRGATDLWQERISPWLTDTGSRAKGEIGDLSESVTSRGSELLTGMKNGATKLWADDINPWLSKTGSRAFDDIGDLADKLIERGTQLLSGLLSGLTELWGNTTGGATTVAGWLAGIGARALAAIPPATRALVSVGADLVSGIMTGIQEAWSGFTSWFDRLLGGLSGRAAGAAQSAVAIQPKTASPDRRAPKPGEVSPDGSTDVLVPDYAAEPGSTPLSVLPQLPGTMPNVTVLTPDTAPPPYSPDGGVVPVTMPDVPLQVEVVNQSAAGNGGAGTGTTPIDLSPKPFAGMSDEGPYLHTLLDYNMPPLTAWTEDVFTRLRKTIDTEVNKIHFAFVNQMGELDWGQTWDPAKLAAEGQKREAAWNEFLKQELAQGKNISNLAEMIAQFNAKFGAYGDAGGSPMVWDFTGGGQTGGNSTGWTPGIPGGATAIGGSPVTINIDASGSQFATRGQIDEYTEMLVTKIDRRLGEMARTRAALGGR